MKITTSRTLRTAAGGLAAAVTLALAVPAPSAVAGPRSLSITDFGAVADDGVDDLAAIDAAAAAAARQGVPLRVPRGTFEHSDVVELDGVRLIGTRGAELRATSTSRQALVLTGQGAGVQDLRLTTVPVSTRLSTDDSARVHVRPEAQDYRISGTTIEGAASAGIIAFGNHGVIEGNHVARTLADGIHLTGGSTDVTVRGNVVRDTGDDLIAVVSYEKFGTWAKDILIERNDVSGGLARGITVSGGEDVTVARNRISRTGGAGIFIASEGNWRTYAVQGLRVVRNSVDRDSQNPAVPEKGGIRLQATNFEPSITDAVFERNEIRRSGDAAVLVVGSASIEATFERTRILEPAGYGIRLVSTVTGALTFHRTTVRAAGLAPFSNASSAEVVSDLPNDPDAVSGGSGEEYVAGNAPKVVDGQAEASWAGSSPLQLSVEPNGTTGTARVAWDAERVTFLFEMTDSTPSSTTADERSDSVEVWVDELNSRAGARTTGDFQLRVGRDGAVSTVVEGLDTSAVQQAVVTTSSGYTVEFSLPWTALEPTDGTVIGFNASANDDSNADGIRDTYLSWVDKNLPYWADTRVYGQLTLVDQA